MKIFITGGTGFIGKYLVKELQGTGNALSLLCRQPEKVSSLTAKTNIDVVKGDLSNIEGWRSEVERFSPDATVHLAWEGLPDYSAATSVRNLKYGLDLLVMLAETGCKTFIGTGSCWEYGQQSGKIAEDATLKPFNAFSAAKNTLHRMGREIAAEYKMNFIWTRLFYVYGPGQRDSSLIPHIINSYREGKKPEIKNLHTQNDFIFVGDVVSALAAILNQPRDYAVYNIGSGVATGVERILEITSNEMDYSYQSSGADSPVTGLYADISGINRDTDWRPETDISEGIRRTVYSYQNIAK